MDRRIDAKVNQAKVNQVEEALSQLYLEESMAFLFANAAVFS